MTSVIAALGAGSGIDTKQLVADLVMAEREPREKALLKKQDDVDTQLSQLSLLKSELGTLKTNLEADAGGALSRTVTSSDTSILTVDSGSYNGTDEFNSNIEVTQLASSQVLVSPLLASENSNVGEGTLTISFGQNTVDSDGYPSAFVNDPSISAVTVTVDSDNNTLLGLRDAINEASDLAKATIMSDTFGVRLIIKSETGVTNSLSIASSDDTGATGAASELARFSFDGDVGFYQSVAAANAIIEMDGFEISQSSNDMVDVIDGLNLTVHQVSDTLVSLNTSTGLDDVKSVLGAFVAEYNYVAELITEMMNGDANFGLGRSLRNVQSELMQIMNTVVGSADGDPISLADIGVSTQRDGTLLLDTDTLVEKYAEDSDAITKLLWGKQTSSSAFIRVTSDISDVTAGEYELTNVVASSGGSLTGSTASSAFSSSLDTTTYTDQNFTVTVDDVASSSIALPSGTYSSGVEFAAALEVKINQDSTLAAFGKRVSVSWSNDQMMFTSAQLGADSSFSISGLDSDLETLVGLSSTTSANGTDSYAEVGDTSATGSGGTWTAPFLSDAYGLVLDILPNSEDATITIEDGIFSAFSAIIEEVLEEGGLVNSRYGGLETKRDSLAEDMETLDSRMAAVEERYQVQFTAMEMKMGFLKQQQTYLNNQIDAWNSSK